MKKYNIQQFESDLRELQIFPDENKINQLIKYYELLVEWNLFMNLTSITDFDEVLKKHFIDSLSIVFTKINFNQKINVIDIGTGAGFPGIPLKIMFPEIKITLLDSLNKRIKFLNEVIGQLGLIDIEAIHGRAEDFAHNNFYREKYDLCVSRAVANLTTLSEYCIPFIKIGGNFISYKSEKISEESMGAQNAISILGGKELKQISFTLPDSPIYRNLYIVEKVSSTPHKYPRRSGLPAQDPLN